MAGNMSGAHGVASRTMPRPMLGMQRMHPQGMVGYNIASQAGMGGGMNPGSIPMPRGAAAAHQQQQVYFLDFILYYDVFCGI